MATQTSLYKLIDLLLTKAAMSGKIRKSTKIKIPYRELSKSVGAEKYTDIELEIEIKCKWVKGS